VRRTRVKICGITREADARSAAELGADAIGFVFWPSSPRAVTAAQAQAMAGVLPPFISRVGVFVNAEPDEVVRLVRLVGLDVVQLHGDEKVERYLGCGARILKAVSVESDEAVERAAELPHGVVPLVDAADRVRRGGTGLVADWERARRLADRRAIVLAGGLSPANVGMALQALRPAAVDVSSGVECEPGVKDPAKLRAFFDAVQTFDRGGV
jgi:phosphoribosylanthranilate isomerase